MVVLLPLQCPGLFIPASSDPTQGEGEGPEDGPRIWSSACPIKETVGDMNIVSSHPAWAAVVQRFICCHLLPYHTHEMHPDSLRAVLMDAHTDSTHQAAG